MLIGQPGVRDRQAAFEVLVTADLIQAPVGLSVDPGDEEARDRRDIGRVTAFGDESFDSSDVGLDDLAVSLQGEDQGALIERPCAIASSIAARPGLVAGILTIRLGRSITSCSRSASR